MPARTFRYRQAYGQAVERIQRVLPASSIVSMDGVGGAGFIFDVVLDPYTPTALADLDAKLAHEGWTRIGRAGTPQEAAHSSLRDLVHFIETGPTSGFGNQVFEHRDPEGSLFPTTVTWYRDVDLTEPIYQVQRVYSGGLVKKAHYRAFDEDGVAVAGVLDLCRGIGQPIERLVSDLPPEELYFQDAPVGYTYTWQNPTGTTLYSGRDKLTFIFWMVPGVWPVVSEGSFWRQQGGSGSVYFGQDGAARGRWYVGGNYFIEQTQLEPFMPVLLVVEVDLTQATATDRIKVYTANKLSGASSFLEIAGGGSAGTVETVWDSANNNPIVSLGSDLSVAWAHALVLPGRTLSSAERAEVLGTPIDGHPVMRDPLLWSFMPEIDFWIPFLGRANRPDGTAIEVINKREFTLEAAA